MPTKAQLFDEIFKVASNEAVKKQKTAVQVKISRWRKHLAEKPNDVTSKKMLKQFENELNELKRSPEVTSSLKKVQALPFIKSVTIKGKKAILETKKIEVDLYGVGESVNVGNYLIIFKSNGKLPNIARKQGAVRTKTSSGYYHHPHISDPGNVCWTHDSRVERILSDAINDKRPDIIATIAWEMLRKVDEGSVYVSAKTFVSSIVKPPLNAKEEAEKSAREVKEWVHNMKIARLIRYLRRKVSLRKRLRILLLAGY